MSDILNKYVSGKKARDDSEGTSSLTFRQMVAFRRRNGDSMAFSYPHLLRLRFNPSRAIVLYFSTHTVWLRGRNLEPLFQRLLSFGVTDIEEVSPRYDIPKEDSNEPVVTQIQIKPRAKRAKKPPAEDSSISPTIMGTTDDQ